ncbi:FecR family protein [Chitinophaga sp. 30R24]|uniref:FecR family protein n=1 Tax=Chitinophaga sp. 30R24 TaxID=3248838 RepID=UPI003B908BDB
MIRLKIKALIDKYLEDTATAGEAKMLDHWLDALAEEAAPLNRNNRSMEQLRRNMLQTIKQRTGQSAVIYPMWKKVAVAAAVLLMGGMATWWATGSYSTARPVAWNELRTAIGEKKMLLLPDSSRIWLGANSVLKYPDHFTDTRQIQLLTGEAFFDIAPAINQPFLVNADSLQVQVLGTSFHIRAYPRQQLEVAVSSGKISVNKNGQVMDILTANQLLVVNRNGYTFTHLSVDPPDIEGWMQEKVVFDNMPVTEALLLLENYYPVKFHVQQPLEKQITGSLSMHLTITQIINVLEDLTDHQLKIKAAGAGNYTVDQ